ncbi:hypothetical protein C8J57DRAFT_1171063 [Mycena rebaudengoi]|nr:hypothetical protein C8J57DRAFT_1171063 [Mycena rebaudengoi]
MRRRRTWSFRVFDKDNNGDLSRAELKTTLMKVYKERRFLSRAMRDVGAALKTLDKMLVLFALIIQFFISLSIFGVDVTSSLTSVYTIGIGASFIFKSAASSAFESLRYTDVVRTILTGDRCFIDDEAMVVKHMGLFATIFTRWDGTESYYFNSQLANKFMCVSYLMLRFQKNVARPRRNSTKTFKSGRQKPTVLKRVIKFQPLFSIDQTTVFVIFMKIGLGIVQKIHVTFHSF